MKNIIQKGSLAFAALMIVALPIATHAADYSYDYGSTYIDSYDTYDYGSTYITPSYDYYDYGSTYIEPYSYDYGSTYIEPYTYDYGSTYITPSYSYSTPYTYTSSYTYTPPSYQYQNQTQHQHQEQTQTSTNTNTNINNNNVTVNVPASQPVVYTYPTPPVYTYPTPVCTLSLSQTYLAYNNYNQPITLSWSSSNATSGFISNGIGSVSASGSRTVNINTTTTFTGTFYGQNGQSTTCSATITVASYVPPVYPTTPYVTLSQVPYTGLDLGPVGTVLYWSFLILWCLVAAYLIAIKKVQVAIARSLKNFLFGGASAEFASQKSSAVSHSDLEVIVNTVRSIIEGSSKETSQVTARAVAAKKVDAVDDFVLSQVHRTRHA